MNLSKRTRFRKRTKHVKKHCKYLNITNTCKLIKHLKNNNISFRKSIVDSKDKTVFRISWVGPHFTTVDYMDNFVPGLEDVD